MSTARFNTLTCRRCGFTGFYRVLMPVSEDPGFHDRLGCASRTMSALTPKPVFFYGLFMDEDLLRDRGLHPNLLGAAVLPGYRIHIGARATLVRDAGARCYGMLIDLPQADAEGLYAPPDVRDYRAERVEVALLDGGETRTATVYNLPADKLSETSNPDYAASLAALARELGLPVAYADDIAAFAGE